MFNFRSLLTWNSDPANLSEEKVDSQVEPHRDSDDQKMVLCQPLELQNQNEKLHVSFRRNPASIWVIVSNSLLVLLGILCGFYL